jgi:transposase
VLGPARGVADTPCFLPVAIVDHARLEKSRPVKGESQIEVELAGWHRLRISGPYDPEALLRLIRSLSG